MHIVHERVAAQYLAENISQRAVFLFNILHGHISESGVYPLLTGAYVELEPEAVVVSRKLFPVPELTLVEHRNIPFVTRLLPQARVHERIELSLPLKQFDPYRSFEDEELIQWVEKPLMFELGYFLGAAGTEELGFVSNGPRAAARVRRVHGVCPRCLCGPTRWANFPLLRRGKSASRDAMNLREVRGGGQFFAFAVLLPQASFAR